MGWNLGEENNGLEAYKRVHEKVFLFSGYNQSMRSAIEFI